MPRITDLELVKAQIAESAAKHKSVLTSNTYGVVWEDGHWIPDVGQYATGEVCPIGAWMLDHQPAPAQINRWEGEHERVANTAIELFGGYFTDGFTSAIDASEFPDDHDGDDAYEFGMKLALELGLQTKDSYIHDEDDDWDEDEDAA